MRGCLVAVLVVFAIVCAGIALGSHDLARRAAENPAGSVAAPDRTAAATKPSWEYTTSTDAMSDGSITEGCLASTNEVHFGWPYGDNPGQICFRKKGRRVDGYVMVRKGQFLCDIEGCNISARIGDGPIFHVRMLEARTDESNILFFEAPEPFMRRLPNAERLRLAADFYQEGEQTLEFAPAGLDIWRITRK